MKLKFFFAAALLAGASFSSFAQTHIEGEEYYKADQFANAKELLLRNMNNSGTNKAVSDFYLGLISLHEGNQADALKYFNEGIQNNPDSSYIYVWL